RPGMASGSAGFSWNSLIDVPRGPIWITPRAVASARGTAMAATVTPAPDARCWSITCRGSIRYTWSEHKTATRPGCWSSIKGRDWQIASAEPDHPPGRPAGGRGDRDPAAARRAAHRPGPAEVPVQQRAVVRCEHEDVPAAAIDQVGKREVDEPVPAAERYGRLGPVVGERCQPAARTAGQHDA